MWWNQYIGTQFQERGRTREAVDCWGLFCIVYKDLLGIDLPAHDGDYQSTNDKDTLSRIIDSESRANWHDIEPGKEAAFDAIILNMRGLPMHVGIVTEPGRMIHCAKGINTVHEDYNSLRWKNRVRGFSRYAA